MRRRLLPGGSAAWAILREAVQVGELVGALAVIAGVLIATRPSHRHSATDSAGNGLVEGRDFRR